MAAGFGFGGQCFETLKLAAQRSCATQEPAYSQDAVTSYRHTCLSVDGTDTAPTLTLERRDLTTNTTVNYTVPVATMPPCADSGASFDPMLAAALVGLVGLGYIGGRQR